MRVVIAVLLLAGTAHAGPDFAGPPGEAPVQQPIYESPAAEPDQLGALAAGDATSDRAFGRSTAIGLVPGQFDISTRTVIEHGSMLSVAAGVANFVELSGDFGYARTVGDTEGIGVKFTLLRRPTWAMGIDVGTRSTSFQSSRYTSLTSNFLLSTCLADCNVLFTIAVGLKIETSSSSLDEFDSNGDNGGPQPVADISLIFAKGLVRPLIEGMTIDGNTNMAFAGLRIGGRHVGVDIGAGVLELQYGSANVGMVLGVGVRP